MPTLLPSGFHPAPAAAPTSNVEGGSLPFQRWYNFKEAFLPSFVEDVIRSMPHPVRTCTDPFGGSGTTSLACQFLGVRPTTVEVNPFLGDLIEAKLTSYDLSGLIADRLRLNDLVRMAELLRDRRAPLFESAPPTFVEPGHAGRWIFNLPIAERIRAFRDAIDEIEDAANRRLFRVLLGSVVIPLSNVTISGKGRRYRRGWETLIRHPNDVDALFDRVVRCAVTDIARYPRRACQEYTLLRGDSRELLSMSEPADLVLFSPPYPNSFDYTDIYNVELWTLGYLRGANDNRALREATLRSHVQIKRTFADGDLGSETLARTLTALRAVEGGLWNPHIPAMLTAYFVDLTEILSTSHSILNENGRVVLVVGDSRYAGVLVDVVAIVRELLPDLGFRCEEARPVRSMRSSPQHGGALDLNESMIRLVRA